MKRSASKPGRRSGRPLSFDREAALHSAMLQFWRTGYETTSIADLIEAMGITPPSLYTAYGDKEALFLECLKHYVQLGTAHSPVGIAEATTAREAAASLLKLSAFWYTQEGFPPGCLVASSAASGSSDSKRVRSAVAKIRKGTQHALEERIVQDVQGGILPANVNARALACTVVAVMQGMSTFARDGAPREVLTEIADTMMKAWPQELAKTPGKAGRLNRNFE